MTKLHLIITAALLAFNATASAQTLLNFTSATVEPYVQGTYGVTVNTQNTVNTSDPLHAFGIPDVSPAGLLNTNTSNGMYPTDEQLDFTFATPATVDSFTYTTFGGQDANLYWTAYNSSLGVIGGGTVGNLPSTASNQFATLTLNLANVKYLVLDNDITTVSTSSDPSSPNNFEFGVSTVTTATVPEPSSWAMILGGLGLLAFLTRRSLRA